jgi:hypothetical protein
MRKNCPEGYDEAQMAIIGKSQASANSFGGKQSVSSQENIKLEKGF